MNLVHRRSEPSPRLASIDDWRDLASSKSDERRAFSRLADGWYLAMIW